VEISERFREKHVRKRVLFISYNPEEENRGIRFGGFSFYQPVHLIGKISNIAGSWRYI